MAEETEETFVAIEDGQVIDSIWKLILTIDWTERWLQALVAFHIVCLIITIFSKQRTNLQIAIFLGLLFTTWSTQYINEYAAQNWRSFAGQQYFDSQGLFISIIFSAPALINCLVIVCVWLYTSGSLLIRVKRAELRKSIKDSKKGKVE